MTWLAVILGVLFLLMSAVDVVPEGRSTHNLVCLPLVAATFTAATLAAMVRGVKQARRGVGQVWCDCLEIACLVGCGVWGYLKIVERVPCRIVRNRL